MVSSHSPTAATGAAAVCAFMLLYNYYMKTRTCSACSHGSVLGRYSDFLIQESAYAFATKMLFIHSEEGKITKNTPIMQLNRMQSVVVVVAVTF